MGYFGRAQWKKRGLWLPLQLLAVWMTEFAFWPARLFAFISTNLFWRIFFFLKFLFLLSFSLLWLVFVPEAHIDGSIQEIRKW